MIWNRLWHSVTSLRTMADMYTLQLPVTVLTKLHNEHASFTYCQLLVRCNVHLAPIFTIYTTHFPVHPPTDVHLTVYSLLTCMTSVICTYHYLLLTDLYISLNDLYISFYLIYWLVHLTIALSDQSDMYRSHRSSNSEMHKSVDNRYWYVQIIEVSQQWDVQVSK